MSSASLDRLLGVLLLAIGATGLLALEGGAPPTAIVFVAHDAIAVALGAAVLIKLRRAVPTALARRAFGRLLLASGLAAGVGAALVGGVAWVASGRLLAVGPLTVMTLHAWAGLAIVPLVLAHLVPARWRLLGPTGLRAAARNGPSRRALLRLAGLAALGVAGFGATTVVDRLQGGTRRFTGSRWLRAGTVPPTTTFIADTAPAIDPSTWRLRVHGLVAEPVELSLQDLAGLPNAETVAVLDCTSGWAVETPWRGPSVQNVLERSRPTAEARRLIVRASTGWSSSFDLPEVRTLMLATSVAGRPLPVANGAPCRLVARDRRGLDWVKWVTDLEVV